MVKPAFPQRQRVLLVESLPSISRLIQLDGTVAAFLTAESVLGARRAFAGPGAQACEIAIIDDSLADGSGVDLLGAMAFLPCSSAVALVSDSMTSVLAERAVGQGAMPMAKPLNVEMLRELLEILEHRRVRRGASSLPPSGVSARPQAILDDDASIEFGSFLLAPRSIQTPHGSFRLRRAERGIMAYLVSRAGHVVSPEDIARAVLARGDGGGVRSVYTHMSNLRCALGRYASLIETITSAAGPRTGYRLSIEWLEAG